MSKGQILGAGGVPAMAPEDAVRFGSEEYLKRVTIPGTYCLHRTVPTINIVPGKMGQPVVIENSMSCRTDCQHYEPPCARYPKGRCRYGEGGAVVAGSGSGAVGLSD